MEVDKSIARRGGEGRQADGATAGGATAGRRGRERGKS